MGASIWNLGGKDGGQVRKEDAQDRLWKPLAEHLGVKMAPEIAKSSPKKRKDGQLGIKIAPKRSPNAAKMTILAPYWVFSDSIFMSRDFVLVSGGISKN